MVAPGELTAQIGTQFMGSWGLLLAKILLWTLYSILIFGFLGVAYIWIVYRIKATVFMVSGMGSGYGVYKKSFDRIKVNKDGSWTWLMRMFKKEAKFPDKYLYGKQVVAFKIGEKYFPGSFDFGGVEDAKITPIPYDVRRKVELEIQQIDIELQKQDWWTQGGKQMLMALGFSLLVIGFAGFVIWLSFTKTNTTIPVMERLTDSLNNFGNIQGKG